MESDPFLDLLKQLVRHPAVVGAELSLFRVLQRELEEAGARVTFFEGLLVAEGRRPRTAHVSVHVDRHGLVCTGPNEFQYAAFVARNRGDLLGDSVSEQTYQKLAGRFHGQIVQAYEPWAGGYLGRGTIRHSYVCERRGNLVFELDGLEHVLPGTPVAYLDRLVVHDGHVAAQLDNVLSVAILVQAFREGFEGTGFFTAQEEAGRSWRYLLEWFHRFGRQSDDLLVLDTSSYPDQAAADAQQVVLRRRDAHAEFDAATVDRLEAACRRLGVTCAYKDAAIAEENARRAAEGKPPLSLGSTELGRVMAASKGAIRGATLQVPTTGYHTAAESASLAAVGAVTNVLREVAFR